MATVISNSDFQTIATAYGHVQSQLSNISGYLYSAADTVAKLDDIYPTYDLINDFVQSYTVNSTSMTTNTPLLAAVRKLNQHITNRGGYTSIGRTDDATSYLAQTSQTVPASWAELSAAAGEPIDDSYIA